MTNAERILGYLKSIAPREATNEEIVSGSGVRPHQQVFQITQRLLSQGTIAGSKAGASGVSASGHTGSRIILGRLGIRKLVLDGQKPPEHFRLWRSRRTKVTAGLREPFIGKWRASTSLH